MVGKIHTREDGAGGRQCCVPGAQCPDNNFFTACECPCDALNDPRGDWANALADIELDAANVASLCGFLVGTTYSYNANTHPGGFSVSDGGGVCEEYRIYAWLLTEDPEGTDQIQVSTTCFCSNCYECYSVSVSDEAYSNCTQATASYAGANGYSWGSDFYGDSRAATPDCDDQWCPGWCARDLIEPYCGPAQPIGWPAGGAAAGVSADFTPTTTDYYWEARVVICYEGVSGSCEVDGCGDPGELCGFMEVSNLAGIAGVSPGNDCAMQFEVEDSWGLFCCDWKGTLYEVEWGAPVGAPQGDITYDGPGYCGVGPILGTITDPDFGPAHGSATADIGEGSYDCWEYLVSSYLAGSEGLTSPAGDCNEAWSSDPCCITAVGIFTPLPTFFGINDPGHENVELEYFDCDGVGTTLTAFGPLDECLYTDESSPLILDWDVGGALPDIEVCCLSCGMAQDVELRFFNSQHNQDCNASLAMRDDGFGTDFHSVDKGSLVDFDTPFAAGAGNSESSYRWTNSSAGCCGAGPNAADGDTVTVKSASSTRDSSDGPLSWLEFQFVVHEACLPSLSPDRNTTRGPISILSPGQADIGTFICDTDDAYSAVTLTIDNPNAFSVDYDVDVTVETSGKTCTNDLGLTVNITGTVAASGQNVIDLLTLFGGGPFLSCCCSEFPSGDCSCVYQDKTFDVALNGTSPAASSLDFTIQTTE